ncbi:hypothetical protein HMPREF9140_00057 [Prevotella micans F0438]|uniref:Uncharacterized protein n=1 Tax=Prevotella micans F0438 TaxID=883158 RepID=H1PZG9_9BACT|nr:hypothetical protein HMPREF9140_00057 [Prevotella micans F0438]
MDEFDQILESGMVFRKPSKPKTNDGKIKTKAKKRNTSPAPMVRVVPNRRQNIASNVRGGAGNCYLCKA